MREQIELDVYIFVVHVVHVPRRSDERVGMREDGYDEAGNESDDEESESEFYTCARLTVRFPRPLDVTTPENPSSLDYPARSDVMARSMRIAFDHERIDDGHWDRYVELIESENADDHPRIVSCEFSFGLKKDEVERDRWQSVRAELMNRFMWRGLLM